VLILPGQAQTRGGESRPEKSRLPPVRRVSLDIPYMKCVPKVGLVGELKVVVESKHAIDFTEGGMPAVLSTPALIGLLERTAREALSACLEPGENSVGIEVELQHLAPTPPGQTVVCLAKVIHAEGSRVCFQLEARDEKEIIARGIHKRQVIRAAAFGRKVAAKQAGGGTLF
jgi:fluoroacetyl-CoA thioesterase